MMYPFKKNYLFSLTFLVNATAFGPKVPEGIYSHVLHSTLVSSGKFESSKIFSEKVVEIVILCVYYAIHFDLNFCWH